MFLKRCCLDLNLFPQTVFKWTSSCKYHRVTEGFFNVPGILEWQVYLIYTKSAVLASWKIALNFYLGHDATVPAKNNFTSFRTFQKKHQRTEQSSIWIKCRKITLKMPKIAATYTLAAFALCNQLFPCSFRSSSELKAIEKKGWIQTWKSSQKRRAEEENEWSLSM